MARVSKDTGARTRGQVSIRGLAFCHSETRSHRFNFENAAAMAPPTGAAADARFGFPPAGLP